MQPKLKVVPQETIEIEHGIPVPKRDNSKKKIYPWEKMLVGDSFVYSHKIASAYPVIRAANERFEGTRKFHVAEREGIVRIWRIK